MTGARPRIVVMGVSGSGKTTVGEQIAARLGLPYLDADTAHPERNVAKMAAGIPLTDADRRPWLERLRDELAANDGIVVSCSALKRRYRDVLRNAGSLQFAHLQIGHDVAFERVAGRADHFMRAELVDSQFTALEPPSADEIDVFCVDAERPVDTIVDDVVARLADASGD